MQNWIFTPPFAAETLWSWLAAHAVPGLEEVVASSQPASSLPSAHRLYRRSLRLPGGPAVVELCEPVSGDGAVQARFLLTRTEDVGEGIRRCRNLLDLDADPAGMQDHLRQTKAFRPLIERRPGLRAPGDVGGIDSLVRAVLHQQVSLASGRAVCARLVAAHGEDLPALMQVGNLSKVFPTAQTWSELDPDELGLPKSRATALVAVASALVSGAVTLDPTQDCEQTKDDLCAIKGIGPWTATIVALRSLHSPDEFSSGDLALRRAAEAVGLPGGAVELQAAAEAWRPWRSYAMHHLWAEYANPSR